MVNASAHPGDPMPAWHVAHAAVTRLVTGWSR